VVIYDLRFAIFQVKIARANRKPSIAFHAAKIACVMKRGGWSRGIKSARAANIPPPKYSGASLAPRSMTAGGPANASISRPKPMKNRVKFDLFEASRNGAEPGFAYNMLHINALRVFYLSKKSVVKPDGFS
jgi:hypothetical protein